MPWAITVFFAPWPANYWQQRHNKIGLRWMRNYILNVLPHLSLKTTEENLEKERRTLMNTLTLTPPELDDETAVKLNNFLYELLEVFEIHYYHQIRRYHRELRMQQMQNEMESSFDDDELSF